MCGSKDYDSVWAGEKGRGGVSEGVIDFETCNCLTIACVGDITLHFPSNLTVSKL